MSGRSEEGASRVPVRRWSGAGWQRAATDLAIREEGLEIRVAGRVLAVTMRTPGDDRALAAGFLLAEGVIREAKDLTRLEPVPGDEHRVEAELRDSALDRWARRRVEREMRITSACGLCGRPTLEDLLFEPPDIEALELAPAAICSLPQAMRRRQRLFAATGAVHAAASFSPSGELVDIAEDVGRHNAVDKVVGRSLLARGSDLTGRGLVVSGRAGLEIVQKALAARCGTLVAIGGATASSVELARSAGMPLWTFVDDASANLHAPAGCAG